MQGTSVLLKTCFYKSISRIFQQQLSRKIIYSKQCQLKPVCLSAGKFDCRTQLLRVTKEIYIAESSYCQEVLTHIKLKMDQQSPLGTVQKSCHSISIHVYFCQLETLDGVFSDQQSELKSYTTQSCAVLPLFFDELMMQGSPGLEDLVLSGFPKHVRAIHSTQETAVFLMCAAIYKYQTVPRSQWKGDVHSLHGMLLSRA